VDAVAASGPGSVLVETYAQGDNCGLTHQWNKGLREAQRLGAKYVCVVNNDLLFVSGEIPVAITPFGSARYVIPAAPGRQTSAGGTECKFNIRVQTLTEETFDTLVGASVARPRSITTNVIVTGQQSGMNVRIPVTITEFATS
jgi:hypothetical protein